MNNVKEKVKLIKDAQGNEAVMVRVDKTMKELMEEKLWSRWSPAYWRPQYDEIIDIVKKSKYGSSSLKEFIPQGVDFITYGSTKPRQWCEVGRGVRYIKPGNVKLTGLYEFQLLWTPENGNLDSPNYRVKKGDLIVNKSGIGTWGRGIIITKDMGKIVVSQDTMRIRLQGINQYYICVFLWSRYGHLQQERNFVGVGAPHIDFDEIRSIKIPMLPDKIQSHIETEYKKMSVYHDKAMESKAKNDEANYKENIEIAEKILKVLIAKTETVIRGERKDVI